MAYKHKYWWNEALKIAETDFIILPYFCTDPDQFKQQKRIKVYSDRDTTLFLQDSDKIHWDNDRLYLNDENDNLWERAMGMDKKHCPGMERTSSIYFHWMLNILHATVHYIYLYIKFWIIFNAILQLRNICLCLKHENVSL